MRHRFEWPLPVARQARLRRRLARGPASGRALGRVVAVDASIADAYDGVIPGEMSATISR
jgi:hypothetical protein